MNQVSEITDHDISQYVNLYNDCVSLKQNKFYKDTNLYKMYTKDELRKYIFELKNLTTMLKAKPREFIMAQIIEYKKPIKKAREVPTFKMICAPSSIDRWTNFCLKRGKTLNTQNRPTDDQIISYNKSQLSRIMEANNVTSEEDFFKDIFLLSQLTKNFVLSHPMATKLESQNFYKQTYDLNLEEIF